MKITEGGHKKGCSCGFCRNKGSFGKKKADGSKAAKGSKTAETDKQVTAESIVEQLLDEHCDCTCRSCGASFDYCKLPESGMGYVKCPTCSEPCTQDMCNAPERASRFNGGHFAGGLGKFSAEPENE